MAGTIFSGWYGRRSGRPYFDELPRLAAGAYKHLAPGLLTVIEAGQSYTVRLVRVPSGCMTAPRLICARCNRACRILYYFHGAACCYQCTPAIYRTHSESHARRTVRAALKVWRRCKTDYKRPEGKPRWQRWPTYEKLSAEADAVWPTIEADDHAPYAAIAKLNAPKPKRGRPPKAKG